MRRSGWLVEKCSGLLEAFARLAGEPFSATVIHEDGLPGTSKPLEEARELYPEVTIVAAVHCHKHVDGAHHSLVLPWDSRHFMRVLDDAYARSQDTRRLRKMQQDNEQLKSIISDQNSRLSTMAEASGRLGEAASSLERLCKTAVDLFGAAARADRLSLMVLEQNGRQELRIAGARGLPDEVVAGTRLEVGQGVAGWVAENKRYLLRKRGLRSSGNGSGERLYKTDSFLSLPLAVGNEVVGVINLTDRVHPREFSDEDVNALQLLCQQTALWLRQCRKLEKAKLLSLIDELTSVYNRRYLMDSLEREISRAKRTGNHFSLVLLDVDHFKMYNDTHGHPAGDKLLKQTARVLQDTLRSTDIICRYGGDEFAVILPETPKTMHGSLRKGVDFIDRLGAAMSKSPFGGGERHTDGGATVSGGVAIYPEDADDAEGLLKIADKTLYEAKRAGRNRICRRYRSGTAYGPSW